MNGFARQTNVPDALDLPEVDPRDEAALVLLGHDLRAALSDVIGGLRLMEPARMDPMHRVQMERVRASGEVLARLLEQGLTVMLGEAIPAAAEDIILRRLLTDLDLRWSGRALGMDIRFTMILQPDLPTRVRLDRLAVDRILSNLLGNAFKYCDRGRVTCEIGVRDGEWLTFVVRDDGPGFPASVMEHSLPFRARPVGMTKPGYGMGLHIAVDLSRRLGGSIALCNLDPSGAEARVDLPLVIAEGSDPVEQPVDQVLAGKRVLIADDNPTSQMILHRFVNKLGGEVVLVQDGVETVGRLEMEDFDLLIVDVEMPRLSGLDVIRCLRTMPGGTARMPVIAVTAYLLRSNRMAILAAGADEMLSKPLMCQHVLADAVRRAFEARQANIATAVTLRQPDVPLLDDGSLLRLLEMTGPETGRELLDRLMADLSGVERGLVQAGTAQDWVAIRHHSHVLISLAGVAGGLRLQDRAQNLNQLAQEETLSMLPAAIHSTLALLDGLIHYVSQVSDDRRLPT